MTTPARLELQGITKQYPGVLANDRVSLTVQPGEIHAVLGENGAGKSTLMKIIYGAVQPDAGEMRFDGQRVRIHSPQQARQLGVAMVFQHFSLFDSLTVAETVWLGRDKAMPLAQVQRRIGEVAAAYGLPLDARRPVHSLSVGEMQRVEIIRALLASPRLLILDEPTSVLTPQAVEKLFATLRQLAAQGCSILYISHKLHEIRALCSACTVMRGGKVAGVCDPRQESNASLSRMMIGAEPPALEQRPHAIGRWTCMRAKSSASPAFPATGKASCWPPFPAKTRARRRRPSALRASPPGIWRLASAARWACTSCPKSGWGAAPCPSWAWRTTCCSRAAKPPARWAGCVWAS